MAKVPEKRMIHVGGGSVPKKAKTEFEDSDSAFLPRSGESLSDSISSAVTLYSPLDICRIRGVLRLAELEIFLVNKGTSDEIVNKIKQRIPEEAYSPFEGDVEKALEGFDEKGWCFYPYARPGDERLFLDGNFTADDLYRQLFLTDYYLPCYTTYDNDKECLKYRQELKQQAKACLVEYDKDNSDRGRCWSWDGTHLAYEVAEKYPHVENDHLERAIRDLNVRFNWNIFSPKAEKAFLDMWLVTDGGLNPLHEELLNFGNPALHALVKETFDEVAGQHHSISEEDIIRLFKETIDEKVDLLLEYYPKYIQKKIEIAKQIGII